MKITSLLFPAVMLLATTPSLGELLYAKQIFPKNADTFIGSIPNHEINKYFDENRAVFKRPDGSYDIPLLAKFSPGQSYAWNFQGKIYYSSFQNFRSNVDPAPLCAISRHEAQCIAAVLGFSECHLLIFDSQRKLAAAAPLSIPRPENMIGKPNCNGVTAIAPAKLVNDALIIILGYHDSRGYCRTFGSPDIAQKEAMCQESSEPDAPIESLSKTALLIRIGKDAEGVISLIQDDKCLPRFNAYATISSARYALKRMRCL